MMIPSLASISALWFLPVTAFLGGIALLVLGIRGRRIDDHPLCRRCGYDLTGRPADSKCCSECGQDVSKPGRVRVGHRRKRPILIAVSLTLLLVVFGAVGTAGYVIWRGIDPNAYKPVWWLLSDARSSVSGTSDAALDELLKRMQAKKLSKEQTNHVVDRALTTQADLSRPWNTGWGDLIETAQLAGDVSDERFHQYLRQAIVPVLHVRARLKRSVNLPLRVERANRMGTVTRIQALFTDGKLQLDGQSVRCVSNGGGPMPAIYTPRSPPIQINYLGGAYGNWYADGADPAFARLADGPHKLRLRFGVDFLNTPNASRITTSQSTIEGTWQLCSEATGIGVTDPALEAKVRGAIHVRFAEANFPPRLELIFDGHTPVPGVFEVFASGDGNVLGRTRTAVPANQPTTTTCYYIEWKYPPPRRFEILLRPDLLAVEQSLDLTEYWNRDIVISDSEIERTK